MSDTTAHMAASCPQCGACFVAITIPPGGMNMRAMSARLGRLSCPDCGNIEGMLWVIGPRHAEAVDRLRREAALD